MEPYIFSERPGSGTGGKGCAMRIKALPPVDCIRLFGRFHACQESSPSPPYPYSTIRLQTVIMDGYAVYVAEHS